jgi:Holliday junction resolvase RusA-like endonuclease
VGWFKAGQPRFDKGTVGMQIIAYWNRWRRLEAKLKTPNADVDAIDKCTLDALQDENGCGCLDDDIRIMPLILLKDYDRTFPRVEIFIWNEA